jgi:hypothetical protein
LARYTPYRNEGLKTVLYNKERLMQYKPAVLKEWVEKLQQEGKNLTSWEEDFIESVSERLNMSLSLSEKQEEILERLYADKTR